jgi:hypothetical protein
MEGKTNMQTIGQVKPWQGAFDHAVECARQALRYRREVQAAEDRNDLAGWRAAKKCQVDRECMVRIYARDALNSATLSPEQHHYVMTGEHL